MSSRALYARDLLKLALYRHIAEVNGPMWDLPVIEWPNPVLERERREREAAQEFAGEILRAVGRLKAREELERQAREGVPFPLARQFPRRVRYVGGKQRIATLALALRKAGL